jgi:hypothetical protein
MASPTVCVTICAPSPDRPLSEFGRTARKNRNRGTECLKLRVQSTASCIGGILYCTTKVSFVL